MSKEITIELTQDQADKIRALRGSCSANLLHGTEIGKLYLSIRSNNPVPPVAKKKPANRKKVA